MPNNWNSVDSVAVAWPPANLDVALYNCKAFRGALIERGMPFPEEVRLESMQYLMEGMDSESAYGVKSMVRWWGTWDGADFTPWDWSGFTLTAICAAAGVPVPTDPSTAPLAAWGTDFVSYKGILNTLTTFRGRLNDAIDDSGNWAPFDTDDLGNEYWNVRNLIFKTDASGTYLKEISWPYSVARYLPDTLHMYVNYISGYSGGMPIYTVDERTGTSPQTFADLEIYNPAFGEAGAIVDLIGSTPTLSYYDP